MVYSHYMEPDRDAWEQLILVYCTEMFKPAQGGGGGGRNHDPLFPIMLVQVPVPVPVPLSCSENEPLGWILTVLQQVRTFSNW